MWTLALSVALAGEPACAAPASAAVLSEAMRAAEEAYGALDLEAFDAAMGQLRGSLPCVDQVLTPSLAASIHRLEGLDAFVSSAPTRSTPAFAAARQIEPAYRFPTALVPEESPVLQEYEAFKDLGGAVQAPEPREGAVHLNGVSTLEKSSSLPVVFQRTDAGGVVADTQYLWPDMPLPDYRARSDAKEKGASSHKGAKIGLLAGAGAAAIGSGVLYGLAAGQAKRYDDPNTPYGELSGLRSSTNTLVMASGGAAIVAVGAGVGGMLVGSF